MTLRVGLFGGCFNPVHNGHLAAAEAARAHLALDRVVFIPSGHPPLKGDAGLLAGAQRLAMLEAALVDRADMTVSTLEIEREGPSYTVDTVRALRRSLPAGSFLVFLLGADCAARLDRWKGIAELHDMLRFAILRRGGVLPSDLDPRLLPVPMADVAVSSTLVRERLARGEEVAELVPPGVADYLASHCPYPVGAQA